VIAIIANKDDGDINDRARHGTRLSAISERARHERETELRNEEPEEPGLPYPVTGVITMRPDWSEPTAALVVHAPITGSAYYLKVVNEAGQVICTAFLRPSTTLRTELPLGTYELRFAMGTRWLGPGEFFGANTEYAKADKKFRFYRSGNFVYGTEVTLARVINGNLETRSLSASQF